MEFGTSLLIALALAVDAFAVALTTGVVLPRVGRRHTFRLAWHFGLFQWGMTLLGWLAGLTIRSFIESLDHWLAFGLLFLVGGRMIVEALRAQGAEAETKDPTRGKKLLMLALATSIDALAVGLSLAVLQVGIWFPALIIGVVAAILTAIGLHLGHFLGATTKLGRKAEIFGGLVLIVIGLNILREHGVW